MIKKYLVWALAIFVAVILTGFIPKLVHQVRLENAYKEYIKTLSESKDFRASYLAELDKLEQILMSRRLIMPSEEKRIEKRTSEIKEKIKKAKEKLARAWEKFCGLAGEEEELCQEPAPPKGQFI